MASVSQLGQVGIISDIAAYDLPLSGWSRGNNVRFENGRVVRSLGFRDILSTTAAMPQYILSAKTAAGNSYIVYADDQGNLYKWLGGSETNVTPLGFVGVSSNDAFTGGTLSGVTYINRGTHTPFMYRPIDDRFVALPNWDSTWRTKSLRPYKDYLIALNVTKGATDNPRMFKASHFALNGEAPESWDQNDLTKLAYETEVTQVDGPLVDGLALRQSFVIYGQTQCVLATFRGGSLLYDFKQIFTGDAGVINQNCILDNEGRHIVFGRTDIYEHDGVQKRSLVDTTNRNYIFENLDMGKSHRCFTFISPFTKEMYFCYPSLDAEASWTGLEGCNKAAIYNPKGGTWSFMDIPNSHGAAIVNVGNVMTWATVGSLVWDELGGSWISQENAKLDTIILTSQSNTAAGLPTSKLLGLDRVDDRPLLPYNTYASAMKPAFVERTGLDLAGTRGFSSYKIINRILPQAKVFGAAPMVFETGSALAPGASVSWASPVNFDPTTQNKVDVRKGGRYLAMRVSMPTANDFELSGYEADDGSVSRR